MATASAQAAEIARLQGFVDRFGAKASKASQAQSRAKSLEKLKENAIEMPAASSGVGPGDARKVRGSKPAQLSFSTGHISFLHVSFVCWACMLIAWFAGFDQTPSIPQGSEGAKKILRWLRHTQSLDWNRVTVPTIPGFSPFLHRPSLPRPHSFRPPSSVIDALFGHHSLPASLCLCLCVALRDIRNERERARGKEK
jgi:hypothetical protein